MGEEDKFKERVELLMPYQINRDMIEKTGNANGDLIVYQLFMIQKLSTAR